MSDNRSFHSEVIRERDSLIERLKARDNQINELLKQTAANRVLLERINELEHELKEAQSACNEAWNAFENGKRKHHRDALTGRCILGCQACAIEKLSAVLKP